MENTSRDVMGQVLCVVVPCGKGSKVLQLARKSGMAGGTILIGRGIAGGTKALLGLSTTKKEIVMMIGPRVYVREALEHIVDVFELDKKNHGIALTIPICFVAGSKSCQTTASKETKGDKNRMFRAIYTIVDKGRGQDVVDAACEAGARGGTIMNARGSGIHETEQLFAMPIEPEKEMVLIVAKDTRAAAITDAIQRRMRLDEPGQGIMFSMHLEDVRGLREEAP